jgi:hypothetical protein
MADRTSHARNLSLMFGTCFLTLQLSFSAAIGFAQSLSPAPIESAQDFTAKLTPQQRQQFEAAVNAFKAQRYADALPNFEALLKALPDDALVSKFAAECALNVGEKELAVTLVKPIAHANPNDWQAAGLLTRACAEAGDTSCRDSGIAHMLELHRRGITPQALRDYPVERVKVGENTLVILASLEPWGRYKVYYLGRVLDGKGNIFFRVTLESSDFDQDTFARLNPKESAAGLRQFSLDAYRETGINSNGQRTQTHYTYKFFVGQPPYETVRDEFIKVANGTSNPMSSRPNLVVEPTK